MSKYKLIASNSRIRIRGKFYTDETLTDEIVENQLKYKPEMLGQVFEKKEVVNTSKTETEETENVIDSESTEHTNKPKESNRKGKQNS